MVAVLANGVHFLLHHCLPGSLSNDAIPRSPTEAENGWRRADGSTIQTPYDYFGGTRQLRKLSSHTAISTAILKNIW
jgi:hypothetical protein